MNIIVNKKEIIIDDEDYDKFSKYHWTSDSSNYVVKPISKWNGEKNIMIKKIYLHRYILNFPEGKVIDHINGNRLDNRKCNLRICDQINNSRNQSRHKNAIRYPKGVARMSGNRIKPFTAQITVNHKNIHLGYFYTPEQAHVAYCEAANKYHGEFARFS